MNKKTIIWTFVILVLLGLSIWKIVVYEKTPGKYDTLAQCLKDKGVTFYGAFWCPHCQAQKAAFGKSAKLLPYVECSTPDSQGQTQICIDKKITSYPTWIFPDGSVEKGEVSLETLAEKSGCALPQ